MRGGVIDPLQSAIAKMKAIYDSEKAMCGNRKEIENGGQRN